MTAGGGGSILAVGIVLLPFSFAALGLAADAVELRKTPHRPCHPVGGFLASGALGGLWGKGPQWALPLLVHLAGGLMSRPAASGPVGAWPWHQIAGQIPRRSGRIFAPQPPAKRAQAPLAGP